jgi:monothiol glutaredoxin
MVKNIQMYEGEEGSKTGLRRAQPILCGPQQVMWSHNSEFMMGIRSKAKKLRQLLPIVGAGGNVRPAASTETTSQAPVVASPAVQPTANVVASSEGRGDESVADYIKSVTEANPVVLFMKGTPGSPMCGFSANAVGILQSYGGALHHEDVIADPEIRQGIKTFSNWPTIPQVYIGGEFLGGSDILMQMHQAGELESLIDAARQA